MTPNEHSERFDQPHTSQNVAVAAPRDRTSSAQSHFVRPSSSIADFGPDLIRRNSHGIGVETIYRAKSYRCLVRDFEALRLHHVELEVSEFASMADAVICNNASVRVRKLIREMIGVDPR